MNEIPTTEQVRHGYSIVDGGLNDRWIRGDAEKRFDRWLAEVKAQERERIIKLLEEGAVLCAGGCGCFVDGGEGDPTCANCY
jgi:hypothetical protein